MKKQTNRLLSILLTLVMLLGMLPTTALATETAHSEHSSYVTHVEAVAGNCTTPGNIEFWYCSYYTCDKCYSDEAMTQEISPADVVITPGVHSDACVGCEYGKSEKTFELFVPSEHPYYDEDEYTNSGLHTLTTQLDGFKFLFVGEYNGNLYAMGNETNEDGSRKAVNITDKVNAGDGSVTIDSDAVEFFTFKDLTNTYVFSPDNGYMTVLDGKIVVHGENLCDIDTSYDVFPQSIRFEQNTELSDYATDKGYLFGWALNTTLILFDDSGAEPKFAPTLMWPVDENGDYISDENGVTIDNRAHNIMLYVERCEHPNMNHTEAADATCNENGAIEHWYCEDCKIYFANAEATEYIVLPEGYSNYEYYLTIYATGHEYGDDNLCDNCGEIWHPNAIRKEGEEIDPTCFEPGSGAYWFCEECGMYMDESKENEYWEEAPAAKIPALGHAFNVDTGECDNCGLANSVYTRITSLDDVNEEDLYIFVAKVGDKYFALGGLDESTGNNEQGVIGCVESGNAIEVVPYEDGSISLLNQNYVGNAVPSEFMFDIDPEQFNSDLDDNFGLTPIMLKLPNYCVYPFQSYSLDNTGYMGVPRYANDVYGMWDGTEWIIDFYTTEVDENTYRDDMDGYTHAEQVARGNIGENISEGDLIMYRGSMYAVGGAMFTLRFREYVNEDGDTEYYFICGEDWCLVGSDGWDSETDTTPTNDTQYAISLYRYDVPTVNTHTCDFGDWIDDENGRTHTRTCKDTECGKTETEDHNWDKGTETKAPTCTETGVKSYTCDDCGATKTESIDALDHDWSKWIDDGVDATTDTHTHTCQRDNCGETEQKAHAWGEWTPDGDANHKKTCADCSGERTDTHKWDDGVITTQPTEEAAGVKTYTCSECGHTKTEPVDKLVHEHSWSDWSPNNDGTHTRSCRCNETETKDCSWDAGVVTKQPTHYEEGIKTYTCSVCSGTKTEAIAKTTDHEWSDWSDNNDGTHTRSCRCNANETDDCTYDSGVITEQPTHTEKGVKTYTCTVCGHTYTEDVPVLTDHAWGEWMINKLDEANTHIRYCICNESQTAPHNFDNGQVTTEATHTSMGVKTFTCTDGCGYSYTEEIPATPDHEWTDWAPNDNETHTRSCRCNANETNPCEWDGGVVTAPTCEEEGTTVYTCTVCGNTKTETTPALDHDWDNWTDTGANAPADIHERSCKRDGCDAKETGNHEWSDWTSTGSTEHQKTCSICSGVRTATHAWDSGEVTKDASTKETGAKKYTCADCGATKTEVIPKIVCDHTWGKWEAENDETHKHTCVNGNGCEAFQRQAHEWNNGVVTTEPTETAEGVMTYTCLTCSYEKPEAIAMLEHTHSFGGWTGDDGADTHTRECENGNTCTATETEPHSCDAWANNEEDTHSGKCSACGAEIVEAHTWGEWVVQNDGSLKRTCTAECGASEELPVLQPITDSVVTTTSDKNAASAELKDNAVVLFNSVLTNEEQTAVAAGNTTVSVYLEVEDIPVDKVSSSDKAAAEAVIEEEDNDLDETTKIGMYLDINLFKEVTTTTEETSGSTTTTTTETEASQITETSNKVTITIEIPDDLINDDASVERIYRIIRVHEDENGNVITDVIEGIFDPVNKTFTFETDKFSTYALAYNDTEKAVTTYTVTYTDGVDGVVVFADQTFTVEAGEATPTISNPTRSGYTFKGWNPSVAATVTGNVTYTATWQKNSSGGYIPSVPTFTPSVEETVGGDTTVDKKYPEQGDKVTITADPDKGYEVDEVIVTDRNGNKVEVIDNGDGTYSFKQPYGKVTITVTFVPEQVGFVDVEENTYYYDAVNWAVANGITNGTSDTTFSPNASCTRAQMVTFLWRAAGCPEPKTTVCPFADVVMDSYYSKAVLWAIENGITNGTGDGTFSPDAECTRAQMAAFLCRMTGGKPVSSANAFADVKADAYYAEAVQWAVENGVTNGTGEGKFSPDAICTRGQMVTFLYRYFVK